MLKRPLRALLDKVPIGGNTEPGRRPTGAAQPNAANASPAGWVPTEYTRTGETVYNDRRPLRFQNLTLTTADIEAIEHAPEFHGGFKIRLAQKTRGNRHAGTLVSHRYANRGYGTQADVTDPNLFTFIAYDEGILVGTVGVRLDSERGLGADELYREEIDTLRNGGCRLCEFTRLAVNASVASKPVLAGLFHTAYLYASVLRGCTHAVIEVNPRHVAFYRRSLGFEPIGVERMNRRVNAPAILLAVPFATIADGLHQYAGKPAAPGASKSLFAYGFSAEEEEGALSRIRSLYPPG